MLIVTVLFLGTTDRVQLILNAICCFSRIDFELVSPHVTSVLPIVVKVNARIHIYGSFPPDGYFSVIFYKSIG